MTEHERMVNSLFNNIALLGDALGLNSQRIFVRGKEFPFDPTSDERADLVFQDRWDAYKGLPEAVMYVVELKSDEIDHEVLGQLQKAIDCLEATGKAIKHWTVVKGVAIAPKYTRSGLKLLDDKGFACFLWCEDKDGVMLKPIKYDPNILW